MDTHELAWAAGFFDGEGYIGVRLGVNGTIHPRIMVSQVGPPIALTRFQLAVGGLGRIRPRKYNPGKELWQYVVTRREEVQAIVAFLWKWLSKPKREQASRTLTRMH